MCIIGSYSFELTVWTKSCVTVLFSFSRQQDLLWQLLLHWKRFVTILELWPIVSVNSWVWQFQMGKKLVNLLSFCLTHMWSLHIQRLNWLVMLFQNISARYWLKTASTFHELPYTLNTCQPFLFWWNSSAFYAIFRHSDRNNHIQPKFKKICASTVRTTLAICKMLHPAK